MPSLGVACRSQAGITRTLALTCQPDGLSATRIAPCWRCERAEGRGRVGRDRHGRRRVHRHAGPAHGKAAPRASSSCEEMAAEHPVEGCNYLLALDMEMDPIPGYEIASWERGYGDFAMKPDLGDAAPHSVARGDGARPLRRPLARRLARPAVTAAGAEGADGSSRRARLHADDRLGARVLPPARDLRGGAGRSATRT